MDELVNHSTVDHSLDLMLRAGCDVADAPGDLLSQSFFLMTK